LSVTRSTPRAPSSPRLHWRLRLLGLLSTLRVTVSPDDVRWCYRHLLGREPESEHAVLAHCRFLSFRALAQHIAASPEYAGRQATILKPSAGAIEGAIAASAFDAAIQEHLQTHPPSAGQRSYIEMHRTRLLDTLNLVQRVLPAGGSVLDYSAVDFFSHAMRRLLPGVRLRNLGGVNFELDDYAERFGVGQHDLCLNTEVLEHLIFDPAQMVHSINRMLRPGGHLVLSTPNAIAVGNAVRCLTGNPPTLWNQINAVSRQYYDRHNRDWTPFEVTRLLEEHGFEVLSLHTRDYYMDTRRVLTQHPRLHELALQQATHAYHGDTQLVLARKVSDSPAPVRKPWLYVLPENKEQPACR
jgi:SAM-dependent methyltransferase